VTRYSAYALLILIAILSSMAILQQMDEMNEIAIWRPT
jgi:hypothetical protein